MIPQKELDALIQYYKGQLTENALLKKVAKIAANKHVLLADPTLPPAWVNAKTKPMSRELTKLTKRIRQFPGGVGAVGAPPGEEPKEGDLVEGPVEQWFKRMIKGTPYASVKKETKTPVSTKPSAKPPMPLKPSTSGKKKPYLSSPPSTSRDDLQSRLEAIRQRPQGLETRLAESRGKGKGKGKREVEQLKPLPGWEDWAAGKKLRRRLDYEDSDDSS